MKAGSAPGIDAATREHEEHEVRVHAFRDLLRHAPRAIRSRKDHESELSSVSFPPADRVVGDQRRLEIEVSERKARVRPPLLLPWRAALALSLAGGLGCLVLALVNPIPGAVGSVACVVLAGTFHAKIRRTHRRFLDAEEQRIRQDVFSAIQADLERDRAAHEGREADRIARATALLSGDAGVCGERLRAAVGGLPVPRGSAARLDMVSPRHARIHVDLYAKSAIPTRRSTLLKTGRVSYRNRPKKEIREDDARGIANLCILLAAVGFDQLPSVEAILVSAFRLGVDPSTGRDAQYCLASVVFERGSFSALKLDRLDPIAAIRGFDSSFSCSASFIVKPVEPLSPAVLTGSEEATAAESIAGASRDGSPGGASGGASAREVRGGARECPSEANAAPRLSALELAQHALALAMACARADGTVSTGELESVSRLIEEQFSLGTTEAKRLSLRSASLAESAISIDLPANALKEHLSPRERQLLMEKILSVSVADGKLHGGELDLFLSIGAALDLAPGFLDDLQRRWAPPGDEEDVSAADRGRWLSALELPQDASLDRPTIERALRRQEDLYAEEKFRLLAPELREMAARRLELARRAGEQLVSELPEPEAADGPLPVADSVVRRENPDLDDIFGRPFTGGT